MQHDGRSREGSVSTLRSLAWPPLALAVVLMSAVWSFVQIVLMPILPYFFVVWWIASAGIQFLIGRFAARRVRLSPGDEQHLPSVTLVGGVLLMFISYAVAQVVVPLLVIRMPMIQAKTPFVPPLLIEIIIVTAGVAGYLVTLQRRSR